MRDTSLHIRAAVAEDVPLIHSLVRALAEYEREPESARLTEAELLRDGFGIGGTSSGGTDSDFGPAFSCLIAEYGGVGCGFALFFPVYSTWDGRSLYLEDLFVQPEYRGHGIGKALLTRVAEIAVATGCVRLDWSVLVWNEPAIGFYEGLGAKRLGEWDRMRLSGKALARVAGRWVAEEGETQILRFAQDDIAGDGSGSPVVLGRSMDKEGSGSMAQDGSGSVAQDGSGSVAQDGRRLGAESGGGSRDGGDCSAGEPARVDEVLS